MKLSEASIGNEPQREYHVARIGSNWQLFIRVMDEIAGEDRWTLSWDSGSRGDRLSFLEMCQLYETSYADHLRQNPTKLDEIVRYTNVYDIEPRDIEAGTSYKSLRKANRIHIQDIAIRRILGANGLKFFQVYDDLLQVRSTSVSELGAGLSPFLIPFVSDGHVITDSPLTPVDPKWNRGSVEDFYQSNRRLVVASSLSTQKLRDGLQREFGETIGVHSVNIPPTQ